MNKGRGDKDGDGWDGMGWSEREGFSLGGRARGKMDLGMMIGETCSKD
jgi:hypothetical protein